MDTRSVVMSITVRTLPRWSELIPVLEVNS